MDRVRKLLVLSLMLGTLVVIPACGSSSSNDRDPKALEGNEWLLAGSSISSTDLSAVGITITFDGENAGGFSGVNTYGGPYTMDSKGALRVGPVYSTLMAGPEAAMRAEATYIDLLEACDAYRLENGTLTLMQGTNDMLIFETQKSVELPGSAWTVTGYNNGAGGVQSVALETTLTIEFDRDGAVAGSAGVNTYRGPCIVQDAAIKIGPLATTRMAGPEELMAQEASFLLAMENSVTWSITRGQLEMRDAGSASQITAKAQSKNE